MSVYDKKLYCVKKAFEKVNNASAPSRIRESLDRMERDSREYNKTIKLLNLTDRGRNEKEGLLRQKGL